MTALTYDALNQRIRDVVKPGFGSQPVDVARLLGDVLDSQSALSVIATGGSQARTLGDIASSLVTTVAGTSRTLTNADYGKLLDFTNGSAITVTVPAGLDPTFQCGISQGGAGQITIVASGVTIREPDTQLKTEKQYVVLTLAAFAQDVYRLIGRTAA